jgi:hypothetical protein
MKIYIIILFVIFFIILWKNYLYYENYVNEPYITLYTTYGLNNRLQTLLSYLYKANKENKVLKVIWVISPFCPDIFENMFKPIPNVEFVYTDKIKEYDYKSWKVDNNNYVSEKYYKLLQPIDSIQNEIDQTKLLLANNYIACHLRRTDGWNHKSYIKDRHTDEEYMEFIDQYPNEFKIYIATDCRVTQQKFIERYGERMVYKKIGDNKDKRQTSLQAAVTDMYICASATYFMRSPGTFSNTILELRKLNEKFDNTTIDFDWKYYVNNNPNIPNNIKSEETALDHYESLGKNLNYSTYPKVYGKNKNKS